MAGAEPERRPSGRDAARYTAALRELYTTRDTARQDAIISELYAPKATFDDNVIRVHGHAGMRLQFHALPRLFKSITWQQDAVDMSEQGGRQTVNISTKQTYFIGKRKIPLQVVTTLALNEAGLIESHHDHWQGQYASWGFVKRATGAATCLFLRLLGV